jgi:hypothetical protein
LIHQEKSVYLLQTVMKLRRSSAYNRRAKAGLRRAQGLDSLRPAQAAHFIMPPLSETLLSKEIPAASQVIRWINGAILVNLAA